MKRLALFALTAGCVDMDAPLPVDGQIYSCALIDRASHVEVDRVDRCGPWTDGDRIAACVVDEFSNEFDVTCVGVQRACNFISCSMEAL